MPNKKQFVCLECGKEFLDWESQRESNVYCSTKCYAKSKKGKVPHNKGKVDRISKPCPVCGKPITGMKSEVNRRKFCSSECSGKNRRNTTDIKQYLIDRIEVQDQTGCWVWQKALNGGYGRPNINGKPIYAHRLSYETFVGPVPEGLYLDHLCRNRACINPKHLEPVTFEENIRRGCQGSKEAMAKHWVTRRTRGVEIGADS